MLRRLIASFILLTDSKLFTATANLTYAFGILLILATFVVGKEVGGSKSWIPLGFMNIQPVEVCKIFTSLALAKYLSMPDLDFSKTRSQLIAAAIAFSPAVLSVLQKEPGAAIVYFSFGIAFYREGFIYFNSTSARTSNNIRILAFPFQQQVTSHSALANIC